MGLGALFGEAALDDGQNDFEYLPLSKVEPRKDQPRDQFSQESLEELAESIREHGVLQPLTVRKLDGGYFQIIAGERRWRAARLAGLTEVPVRIVAADDKKAMELAMVENLQRENLNPVEEAKGYKALMTDYGMTQEQVAASVGKSRPVVANALRILSLPQEVVALVEEGKLSPGLARVVLSVEGDALRCVVAEKIAADNMTVRDAESYVKKLKNAGKPQKAATTEMMARYIQDVEKRLSDNLGRRVKIVDGKRKGRFEIEYYGRDDFELLLTSIAGLHVNKE